MTCPGGVILQSTFDIMYRAMQPTCDPAWYALGTPRDKRRVRAHVAGGASCVFCAVVVTVIMLVMLMSMQGGGDGERGVCCVDGRGDGAIGSECRRRGDITWHDRHHD